MWGHQGDKGYRDTMVTGLVEAVALGDVSRYGGDKWWPVLSRLGWGDRGQ